MQMTSLSAATSLRRTRSGAQYTSEPRPDTRKRARTPASSPLKHAVRTRPGRKRASTSQVVHIDETVFVSDDDDDDDDQPAENLIPIRPTTRSATKVTPAKAVPHAHPTSADINTDDGLGDEDADGEDDEDMDADGEPDPDA
ncbi:hypothetical protein DACRYDRAFT_20310 [Dacryopinax primogenitus]|uniref:Uncharacterized protein n=1 Tax=Dacryopinax primogenitus (strain DJM 731) TaxID=1858805 RepID=M5G7D1_DACPD|nr:uncharacterized protein DACRYDRAFT_20310 [Dacryopinax primogenitus]EJU04639.1 hypothetical protein DACRYDRAFT_20310 [Dacryopinax primogenitus]